MFKKKPQGSFGPVRECQMQKRSKPGCDSVYLYYPQEETVAELRTVEAEAASFLDQISRYVTLRQTKIYVQVFFFFPYYLNAIFCRYYITRAKLVSKMAKYPHVVSHISSTRTWHLDQRYSSYFTCIIYILTFIGGLSSHGDGDWWEGIHQPQDHSVRAEKSIRKYCCNNKLLIIFEDYPVQKKFRLLHVCVVLRTDLIKQNCLAGNITWHDPEEHREDQEAEEQQHWCPVLRSPSPFVLGPLFHHLELALAFRWF